MDKKKKGKDNKQPLAVPKEAKEWLASASDYSLAMKETNVVAFPKAEVSSEQAIAYLRKEGLVLDADVPRGYVLLTYKDAPLGFVKNIGNRANNLYPQEWRIRSGYLPEEVVCVY